VSTGLGTVRHIVCKRTKPPPPTADATCIAIDESTQDRYLCKDRSKVDWLPMVEWITQHLARRCGLLVPDCFVIEVAANPGSYLFGSKWEGGAEQYSPGLVAKVTNPDHFSAIHAFDLLVQNVDRHLNNYLYLQLAGDTVVKAVDHSRCLWFSGWPMPAPPPEATSNTMQGKAHWVVEAPWNANAARHVVSLWGQITQSDVQAILDLAPNTWVLPSRRDQLLTWWGSPDWVQRTTQVLGALP
jgi:hypothetical protein